MKKRKSSYGVAKTHGATICGKQTEAWKCWIGMIARCTYKSRPDYKYYGGRGITICKRWKDSFLNFLADMGERPAGLTLDRIDNNKGYSPKNCRWASRKEQRINQEKRTHMIEFNGDILSLKDWGRRIGVSQGGMMRRFTSGWTTERMVTEKAVIGKNQFSRKTS